jgi:hypothetical protein
MSAHSVASALQKALHSIQPHRTSSAILNMGQFMQRPRPAGPSATPNVVPKELLVCERRGQGS